MPNESMHNFFLQMMGEDDAAKLGIELMGLCEAHTLGDVGKAMAMATAAYLFNVEIQNEGKGDVAVAMYKEMVDAIYDTLMVKIKMIEDAGVDVRSDVMEQVQQVQDSIKSKMN